MSDLPRTPSATVSSYRLDAALNQELMQGTRSVLPPSKNGFEEGLPAVVFPQRPDLLQANDEDYFPKDGKRRWSAPQIYHAM